jgi:hypothetical protein
LSCSGLTVAVGGLVPDDLPDHAAGVDAERLKLDLSGQHAVDQKDHVEQWWLSSVLVWS